jgi:glutamate dehydrogenase (NAD(P)+)
MIEAGAVLVGVSEIKAGIANPDGIDLEALMTYRREAGTVAGFPGAGTLPTSLAALEVDCEILIPAALENQITTPPAPGIRAGLWGGGPTAPTTDDADQLLRERGAIVVPDVFLNAGGVTVSYFEWLKNLQHVAFGRLEKRFDQGAYRRLLNAIEGATTKTFSVAESNLLARGADELDIVNSGLEETMAFAYRQIREVCAEHGDAVDLRTGAMIRAIRKVVVAYEELGIFP